MSASGYRTREPLDNELEPERPVLLKQATTMLIKNKVLTVTDIIDNITLPQIEIEHLCRYN